MELSGSNYLYTIFTGSITYAGFAALIVIFRQTIGGGVSSYDVFVIRVVLMRSFIVAFSAMLPPALALFDLPPHLIWRTASLCAAFLLALFTWAFHIRRRAITGLPVSNWFLISVGAQSLITIFLLMTAFGLFIRPGPGPFVASLTALLLVAAVAYPVALDVLLRGRVKKE
jgi:hypothetical protein